MMILKQNITRIVTLVLLLSVFLLLLFDRCHDGSPKYLDQLHDNVFQVARGTEEQSNPVWNPHEDCLYYYEEGGKIKAAHADSGALFSVTEGYNPRITESSTDIYFFRSNCDFDNIMERCHDLQACVVDEQGDNQRTLGTFTNLIINPEDAVWSPLGDKVVLFVLEECASGACPVFKSGKWFNSRIAIWEPVEGQFEVIDGFQQTYYGNLPQWSPDGTRIALIGKPDITMEQREYLTELPSDDIWVLDVATLKITNISSDMDHNYSPSWSPDGSKIAYHSFSDKPRENNSIPMEIHEIWTASTDGSEKKLVDTNQIPIFANSSRLGCVWSPDGSWIAYISYEMKNNDNDSSKDSLVQEIIVVEVEGTRREVILRTPYSKGWFYGNLSWSPDGAYIALEWSRMGGDKLENTHIYMLQLQ